MSNNFCGKCGAKLDKNTGLCPRCDAEKLLTLKSDNSTEATGTKEPIPGNTLLSKKQAKKQRKKERKAAKETKKKEMRANWSAGKKVRNFFLKVFLIVLIIGVLVAGLIGLLVYLGIVDISTTSDVINKLETTTHPADIEKSIPDTDMNGIVYYESSEDNIVTEDGITFINNEILVILESAQYRNDLDNYLLGIGGHVVGELSDIAEYQIVLDKTYSHGTLTAIADELRSFDWVIYVSLNYAVKTKPEYTPNDSKWNNQWDATPGGDNWGIEAIEALSAWDHIDDFHTVNIGVYDTIFDVRHEDLNFAEQPLGNITAMNHVSKKDKEEDWYKHGTHTAGTISATFDNKKGVSGVSVKTNLYGVSSKGLSINDYHSSQAFNIALTYLIISKKCSVINVSLGFDELTFNASRGNIAALNALDEVSTSISNYLQVLVDQGYSFVICKSAGNQNKIGGGEEYKYYLKDSYNDNKEYMYYSHDDYIDFLNGIADEDCSDYFRRHKKDLSRRLSNGGCLDDGNVDAKYDILGAITNNKVADRIIIVGSAENLGSHYEGGFLWFGRTKIHDGYKIADFSQCGERVDILAPGVSIHSTIPNGYGRMSGTSMAAPHVTGIVGLIYSASKNMKGEDAKKIVIDTASGAYGRESYGIANARKAVESALQYTSIFNDSKDNNKGQTELNKEEIPTDAVIFNGHHYYLYMGDKALLYEEAAQYCNSKGGYLATVTSKEENDFIYSYIQNSGYENAYFGLSDSKSEGIWEWCTGEESSYTNWHNGEPNGENPNEDYAMFYYKYSDGTWNDGDFGDSTVNGGNAFICEWGDYSSQEVATTGDGSSLRDRNVVLALDVSGSMEGTPIDETKNASNNFVNTILKENADIGIVTYDDSSEIATGLSNDKYNLQNIISSLGTGGDTNIEAGLRDAAWMLEKTGGKKKIIVLMSDGEPNNGLQGDDLIEYADSIKKEGIRIYTIGFFDSLSDKSSAQYLMEHIASDGCHYEASGADQLVFFFEDMADQINGQKYIYVRIACPVDVSVRYNGEELNSMEKNLNTRTSFGTLTFEDSREDFGEGIDDRVKVLRLKDGTDYDVNLTGTGHGIMNYTIGFMDDEGEYSDLRQFKDIKITKKTTIDTVASNTDESMLNIDQDGDGKYDLRLRAQNNSVAEEIPLYVNSWIKYIIIAALILILLDIIAIVLYLRSKRRGR